ncbi:MAG TPA: ATP-binding protein, partial [Actinomycetota bacterium]|nr:ATP-binding protein [Actinomycetota bacterium]
LHEPARDGPAREQRVNLRLLAERVASAAALGSRGNVVVEAPDEWAVTDPDRLERALLNLLDNALKYTPEDAPVHLIVVREGDRLSVTVADRGPGVSPDILPRMFTPYTTDPSRSDGTGLGLNSVKRLVQDIGGQISYSRFREWTRFTITLPDLEEAKA